MPYMDLAWISYGQLLAGNWDMGVDEVMKAGVDEEGFK